MDKFGVITSRSIRRVSLVVMLIDDFTGKVITGSNARVWIENEKPPIKKSEGWNVFLNLSEGEYILNAEGGFYSRSTVACKIVDEKSDIVTIRLLPNSLYPIPSDCLRIEGNGEPESKVVIYSDDKSAAFKLLSDIKKGTQTIGIYHPDAVNIEGKMLNIISSDGKSEFIRVGSKSENEKFEYKILDKIKNDFSKVGTILVTATETIVDEDGKFFIFLRSCSQENTEIVCELLGKKAKKKVIKTGSEKYIKIDMK